MSKRKMRVEFHDEYMFLAVLLFCALVFCRPLADCVRCLCSLLVVPRECGHFAHCSHASRELLRRVVLAYGLLQPLWFWLASRATTIYAWLHEAQAAAHNSTSPSADLASPHACVRSTAVILNQTALRHGRLEMTSASGVTLVDALVLCMPFAVVSAITTAAWKHLVDIRVLLPDDAWNSDLFADDAKVWEYEMLYLLEAALATFAVVHVSAAGVDPAMAVYATVAVCSFQVFFAVCARYDHRAAAASCITSAVTVAFLLIVIELALRLIDRSSPARIACGVVGFGAQLLVAGGHQVAAGDASVGTVLSLRALTSLAVSATLLTALALRIC